MKLVIGSCGPLNDCKFDVKRYNVLFGYKGKSLIAKNLWFFLNIDDMYVASKAKNLSVKGFSEFLASCYLKYLGNLIHRVPLLLEFHYNNEDYIVVESSIEHVINITLSDSLIDKYIADSADVNLVSWKQVYVPSERDLVYYSFSSTINDLFISDYIDYYHKIVMSDFAKGIVYDSPVNELISKIFELSYRITDQQEYLDSIPVSELSTSTKKSLALVNTIIHQLNYCKQSSFLAIEELESNQYPLIQMYLTYLTFLFTNRSNNVLVLTNSPYVLGTISVALDSFELKSNTKLTDYVADYIPLDSSEVSAYYITSDGTFEQGLVDGLIANELMDDASDVINNLSDKLFDLK